MNTVQNNVPDKLVKAAKKIFGKKNIETIEPLGSHYNKKHKIVVFVPLKNADELTFAMASAGAGVIGNYTVCSFRMSGIGTFLGGEGSKPKTGRKSKFEMTEEVRLEMICDKENLDSAIDKIYEVHPYEEPAYEIYDINVREKTASMKTAFVRLAAKVTVKDIFKKINGKIDTDNLPRKIRNSRVKQAVIDHSLNGRSADIQDGKTLYIKINKNITNIELK
jgi:hypothetical protein